MPLFSPLWLKRAQGSKTLRRPARRRPVRRLLLENLEDRMVLSTTLLVVPSAVSTDSTHFHDLASADAAASPGDVIQIEPNSNPGAGTIDKTLTVQGDPADSPASLPQIGNTSNSFLTLAASGIVLNNLNLGEVLINLGQTGETISNSLVQVISQHFGSGTNGSDRVFNDTIAGFVSLGNLSNGGGSASGDQVVNNNFINSLFTNSFLASVDDDNGALIQGNSFTSTSSGAVAAILVQDSTSVSILNNRIAFTGSDPNNLGIEVVNNSRPIGVTISNNRISTNNVATGIFFQKSGSNSFSASVANNNLVLNLVGIAVTAGPFGITDFGTIDAGGGSLGSLGGNDFHGFTGSGGHFAITTLIQGGLSTTDTVSALNNSFSVTPSSTVNAAAGKIDVSTALDANHAVVDALYDDFLQRSGNPSPELDFWAGHLASLGQGIVASDIIRSLEGYTRLVDSLYGKILGRTPDSSEEAFWVSRLQGGATLEQVIAGFLGSAEYAARANTLAFAPTNSDVNYIQSLYTLLLGRTASASELSFWSGQLAAFGRTSVALGFLASTEFRSDVVQALYSPNTPLPSTSFVGIVPELLNRSTLPAPAEVSFWVNSGLDLLRIEVAIAGSAEFFTNG